MIICNMQSALVTPLVTIQKIEKFGFTIPVMSPKEEDGIENSVELCKPSFRSSLTWVCTVCYGLLY